MISLTIVFGPAATAIQFLYKDRADAEKALNATKSGSDDFCVVKDDFAQYAEFRNSTIHARVIEDLVEAGNAVIERAIQNQKNQVKGNNRAANDPALKFAMNNGGGVLNHPGMPAGAARRNM